jgi:hypothetical protein
VIAVNGGGGGAGAGAGAGAGGGESELERDIRKAREEEGAAVDGRQEEEGAEEQGAATTAAGGGHGKDTISIDALKRFFKTHDSSLLLGVAGEDPSDEDYEEVRVQQIIILRRCVYRCIVKVL